MCIISLLSVLIIWLFTYPKYTYISVYNINTFLNKKAIANEKVIPNIKLFDGNKSYDLKSIIKKYNKILLYRYLSLYKNRNVGRSYILTDFWINHLYTFKCIF